jgi:transposase InsO family protein
MFLLIRKDESFGVFKQWQAEVERQSVKKVKILRSDQGGEYISNEFKKYLKDFGIKKEFTVTYAPEQNGRAQRVNMTLMDMARSMINGADLGKSFWGEAIMTPCYLKNRSPHARPQGNCTLEEKWRLQAIH